MRSDKKRRQRNRMVKSQVKSAEKKVRQAQSRDQAEQLTAKNPSWPRQ